MGYVTPEFQFTALGRESIALKPPNRRIKYLTGAISVPLLSLGEAYFPSNEEEFEDLSETMPMSSDYSQVAVSNPDLR